MEMKEKYTISEATQLLGFKSRSTLNKRTKTAGNDGISFEKDENGNKVIRLIELQRVFPDRMQEILSNKSNAANTIAKTSTKIQPRTTQNMVNAALLQHKIESLESQLEQEKSERIRERLEAQDRDSKAEAREHLMQQQVGELTKSISQHTRLLEDHRSPKEKTKGSRSSLIKEIGDVLKFFAVAVIMVTLIIGIVYFFG
ncbi:MAG: hypothetical protein AAFP77_18195 [Bacteroidota bacterium]